MSGRRALTRRDDAGLARLPTAARRPLTRSPWSATNRTYRCGRSSSAAKKPPVRSTGQQDTLDDLVGERVRRESVGRDCRRSGGGTCGRRRESGARSARSLEWSAPRRGRYSRSGCRSVGSITRRSGPPGRADRGRAGGGFTAWRPVSFIGRSVVGWAVPRRRSAVPYVLTAPVAVNHGPGRRLALPFGHLEGVDDEFGADGIGDRPADDPPGPDVDHRGAVGLCLPVGCSVMSVQHTRSGLSAANFRWTRSAWIAGSGPLPGRFRWWLIPTSPAAAMRRATRFRPHRTPSPRRSSAWTGGTPYVPVPGLSCPYSPSGGTVSMRSPRLLSTPARMRIAVSRWRSWSL